MRVVDVITDVWQLRRRALLVCTVLFGALIVLMGALAAYLHATKRTTASPADTGRRAPAHATQSDSSTGHAGATDVAEWNAKAAVIPSASPAYPAVSAAARHDPAAYAQAFAIELFTRNYSTDRQQLLAWAQYEDAPLRSTNYPRADWSKALVDSLTDLTWDDAIDTPVPSDGEWLTLRSERATETVSNVKVTTDPQWQQQVAAGYQPPDPLATVRDISLTVVRRADAPGLAATSRYQVALALQLGTSGHGGYGVAATNNYVVRKVG